MTQGYGRFADAEDLRAGHVDDERRVGGVRKAFDRDFPATPVEVIENVSVLPAVPATVTGN